MSEELLQAFQAYDWDQSPEWRAYLCRVEIPPGREDALQRVKAKFYKREVDPDFDVSLVAGPASAPKREEPHREAPAAAGPPPQQRPPPPQQPGRAAAGAAAFARPDLVKPTLLVAHLVLVVTALLSLQPVNQMLSWHAYRVFCFVAIGAHLLRIYLRHGLPTLAAVREYMGAVGATTDFFLLILSCLCHSKPGTFRLGVVPIGVMAAYHASAYMNAAFGGGSRLWARLGLPAHRWLAAHQEQALLLNAMVEILLGFMAVLAAFRGGFMANAPTGFAYWMQLRARLASPESGAHHATVWAWIGERVGPLLRHVPALDRFVGLLVMWFQSGHRR